MTNPYAPPRAAVADIVDPNARVALAERGTRLGASILDTIIFGAMVYAPFLVFGMLDASAASAPASDAPFGGMVAVGLTLSLVGLVVWFGFTISYLRRNGQSIGKKILGIKIVRTDGSPASLGRIFVLRNVVVTILNFIPLFAFVDVLFIFAESRQCLHDKLADTIVIVA